MKHSFIDLSSAVVCELLVLYGRGRRQILHTSSSVACASHATVQPTVALTVSIGFIIIIFFSCYYCNYDCVHGDLFVCSGT